MEIRRLEGDDGAATTEFVILTPILLTFLMLIIQAGLYFHAVSVASAAAQEGSRMAAMEGEQNRIAAGEGEAEDFVQAVAPNLLTDVDATGSMVDSGEAVQVNVDANVLEVYPFPFLLDLSVNETSESVVEEFRPANEAPPTDS
ncbi:MAG: TadE/TadG family type IV pilus assembly protein [Acidimicrobiales bacterium]